MIASLVHYYQRSTELAPYRMQYKPIPWVIVLSEEGEFLSLESTRDEGQKAQLFLVPQAVQRTSAPIPNQGWDNASYVLQLSSNVLPWVEEKLHLLHDLSYQIDDNGVEKRLVQIEGKLVVLPPELLPGGALLKELPPELVPSFRDWKEFSSSGEDLSHAANLDEKNKQKSTLRVDATLEKERQKNRRNYQSFKTWVEEQYQQHPQQSSLRALYLFYQKDWWQQLWGLYQEPLWSVFKEELQLPISFKVEGHSHILPEELGTISQVNEPSENYGLCLISGQHQPLAHTHNPVPIPGSQATARLVSFQAHTGYESYGKEKTANAPISAQVEFAYTTALNALLRKDSVHQFSVSNRTYVAWMQQACPFEEELLQDILLCIAPYALQVKIKGRENKKTVSSLHFLKTDELCALYTTWQKKIRGWEQNRGALQLMVVALYPNGARIAVSYEVRLEMISLLEHLKQYLALMSWQDPRPNPKPYYAFTSLLMAVAADNEVENLPPKWSDDCLRVLLEGAILPAEVYKACLRQMMRSCSLQYGQLALLKTYFLQLGIGPIQAELNEKETCPYYLLGRYFAYLEKFVGFANRWNFRMRYLPPILQFPFPTFKELLRRFPLKNFPQPLAQSVQEVVKRLVKVFLPQRPTEIDKGWFFMGYAHQLQRIVTN